MSRFAGRVAIVTGSARGIGLATATRLASEGATVVVNDVDRAAIASAVDADGSAGAPAGGRAVDGLADITVEREVDHLVARVVADLGGVDILVNNAGGAMPGTSWGPSRRRRSPTGSASSPSTSPVRSCARGPCWARCSPAVAATSSANAPHPSRQPERQDLLDSWVHLGRVGRYDEFAAAIAFLCSEDASYLSGAMIPVDGGFHRFQMLWGELP